MLRSLIRVRHALRTRRARAALRKGMEMKGTENGKGKEAHDYKRSMQSAHRLTTMMARGLCERLNLSRQMGPGSAYMAVYDIAQMETERGGDLEKLCDRMVQAYSAWMEEAPNLEYQWGVAQVLWEMAGGTDPLLLGRARAIIQWPTKQRRDQKWEEFMSKGKDDESQ